MKEKRTSTLFLELEKNGTFAKFAATNDESFIRSDFSEYISLLSREKEMAPIQVIKNAQIDRVYGYQLFNGIRKPSRDKVLQLAFGFALSLEETQKLLRMANKSSLYPKIKRDAAIIYGLNNRMQILEMQEFLFSLDLPVIGGGA